jgi:uncharacterized protein YjdB
MGLNDIKISLVIGEEKYFKMNRKIILLPLSFAAILALAACNPGTQAASSAEPVVSSAAAATVTSVTVTAAGGASTVYIAGTLQLSAAVVGTGNPSTLVTWSTSAATVATVSASGLVTGVAAGSVTITATSKADSTKTGTITLTVAEKITKVSEINAVGTVYTIKAVVVGKDLQDVAFSDGTGIIYAYFKGTKDATNKIADFAIGDYFKIVASVGYYFGVYQLYAEDGTDSNKAAVSAFTATKLTETAPTIDKTAVDFTSAMIDAHKATPSDWKNSAIKFIKFQSMVTIEAGSSYNTYHATVGTYDVHLHSLDDKVAFPGVVDGGLYDVVALDFGYNTSGSYQNVLVTSLTKKDVALTGLTISGADSVKVGDTTKLTAVAAPVGADKSVTWSSSDATLAKVDASTGVVTGVAEAAAVTITATSTVDSTITATKTISVIQPDPIAVPSTGITINTKTLKESSAAGEGWNAFTSYAQTPITTKLNGVEVIGSVNKNVMFNTYEPWKTIGTDLGYDVLQIKQATGVAFKFSAPFTQVASVNITFMATVATLDSTKIPVVSVAGTAVSVTTAQTSGAYAGTKLKDVTYTSGNVSKTRFQFLPYVWQEHSRSKHIQVANNGREGHQLRL